MELIKKINVPMALLCLLSLRLVFTENTYAVALGVLGLAGLYAYTLFLNTKKVVPLDKQVTDELESMRNQISNLTVKANLNRPTPKPGERFF